MARKVTDVELVEQKEYWYVLPTLELRLTEDCREGVGAVPLCPSPCGIPAKPISTPSPLHHRTLPCPSKPVSDSVQLAAAQFDVRFFQLTATIGEGNGESLNRLAVVPPRAHSGRCWQ
jgi:hypothetical protein